ncbi:Beta-galactosidase [Anaerohalosphaera lusitana]|uniref:Beta-galactosidase n=1 Tax=Anaerohalosphaera lusitana TaxID=1936003 RepID=A0A1U9NJ21_9BACT|nr:discoidin domain-containing protein [Anaerohalosphaera lusitana]AQT67590.1 Beta-galactosidase [Anaerohalosphaera lusitana]
MVSRVLALVLCAVCGAVVAAESSASREIINFNHGWEFVRLNDKPRPIDAKFLVPREQMEIVSVSSEETEGENAGAVNAIDGNEGTFWHSKWQGQAAEYPHEMVIDLGGVFELQGLTYLARQSGSNGMIGRFEVYASMEPVEWGKAVASGRFRDEKRLQVISFAEPVEAEYVKLVALDAIHGEDFASVAELGFLRVNLAEKGADWESQFSVLHVSEDDLEGDEDESSVGDELGAVADKEWEKVSLPHTAYVEPLVVNNQWQGICFYRKTFDVGEELAGRKIFVEFEGAMELADVWVNGEHLMQHAGGYLPFTVDLTDVVEYGEENEMLVRLDNNDHPTIPPGKPLSGVDFSYYHGIYRDVRMVVTNEVYITDAVSANEIAGGGVFVQYENVSEKAATVKVKTHVRNDSINMRDVVIEQVLRDAEGAVVLRDKSEAVKVTAGGNEHIQQSFVVDDPKLWSPDSPNLYRMVTKVTAGGEVIDSVRTRIGIRWFEFTREGGCKINGEPVYLLGTNRHQEHPYIGNALSNNAQWRDVWRIRNAGYNTLRLGHYPQDPAVLEACDELGMIVIEPIPGWQFFNNNETFVKRVYRDVRDMIRRDRNHACVALWEVVLNESHAPHFVERNAYEIAHEEMPGEQCFACGDPYGAKCWDVSYNQWREDITRPQDAQPDVPGFIREYGDYEFGGHYSTTRQYRGDGEKALLQSAWNFQWSLNRYKAQYPWTVGCATWLMFDHNRGGSENIEGSGTSDIFRLPKFTYYFFQSQRDPDVDLPDGIESGPMVEIANYWTKRKSPTKVVVYSNCDEVALLVNGERVARQRPDDGPSTEYGPRYEGGRPFDGGNCENLESPPFTFSGVDYEPGTLKAVGYIDGEAAANDAVVTAGEPAGLRIEFGTCGKELAADGADVIFVYATVVDGEGNPNYLADNGVTFEVDGPGRIFGPSVVDAEAGVATVLLQATREPGEIIVTAEADGLEAAAATIRSR